MWSVVVTTVADISLRPELQPFGQKYAHTPNILKLANSGTVFQNAYCQVTFMIPAELDDCKLIDLSRNAYMYYVIVLLWCRRSIASSLTCLINS